MAAWRVGICAQLLSAAAITTVISAVAGCGQVAVSTHAGAPRPLAKVVDVQFERCVDRTETPGRDLGSEATRAFAEKLRATKEFVIADGARYRLACEVSSFVEGSAFKRWLWPGWGSTVGQVSAMLTDNTTGEVMIVARGNATVSGGGLYSLGADSYIVAMAVESVVNQLCAWARGEEPEGGGQAGNAPERRNPQ